MEQLIGEIRLFTYNFVPMGWLRCDGTIVSITEYQTLYALLMTRYGGDGMTNFALPDLTGAEPDPNTMYCIAWEGIFPTRP